MFEMMANTIAIVMMIVFGHVDNAGKLYGTDDANGYEYDDDDDDDDEGW